MADETPPVVETPPAPTAEELAAERDRVTAENAALTQRLADIESEREAAAAAAQAAARAPAPAPAASYRDVITGAKSFAKKGDPVAAALVQQHYAVQILSAPPEMRDDLAAEFMRGGYDDIPDARAVVERRHAQARENQLQGEQKKKDEEIASLKAALAAAQNTNTVPGMSARTGPAPPDLTKPISEDQWKQMNAGLSGTERRANQKLLNQGKIQIQG